MIFFALVELAKWVAFAASFCLAVLIFVLAVAGLWRSRWLNAIFSIVSTAALIFALCHVPKLDYYIGYGIQTQVVRYSRIIEVMLVLALLSGLCIRGLGRWVSIAATACAYISFLIF